MGVVRQPKCVNALMYLSTLAIIVVVVVVVVVVAVVVLVVVVVVVVARFRCAKDKTAKTVLEADVLLKEKLWFCKNTLQDCNGRGRRSQTGTTIIIH